MKKIAFLFILLFNITLISNDLLASDIVTINGDFVEDFFAVRYVLQESDVAVKTNNNTFEQNFIGNRVKDIDNLTLYLQDSTIKGDVIGLERGDCGTVSSVIQVNLNGAVIDGDLLLTSDVNDYDGDDRRDSNILNMNSGQVSGIVSLGAGADQNTMNITGGLVGYYDDNGDFVAGTIYAGTTEDITENLSTNASVTLTGLDDHSDFLSTFVEVEGTDSGMIYAGNLADDGTSNISFNKVDGTYYGGFSGFDTFNVKAETDLTLGGETYTTNYIHVHGTLDPNGKTIDDISSDEGGDDTLNVLVYEDGEISTQLISTDRVVMSNYGEINGISTKKKITVKNYGEMTGEYDGYYLDITNNSEISGDTSFIANSKIEFVNSSTATATGNLEVDGEVLIFENDGLFTDLFITNLQEDVVIDNYGEISGIGGIYSSGNALTLNNSGTLTGEQTFEDVNLNNNSSISSLKLTSDTGLVNIVNNSTISTMTLNSENGGTYTFLNDVDGTLTNYLTINGGLSLLENYGLFSSLNIINRTNDLVIDNYNDVLNSTIINYADDLAVNNNEDGVLSNMTINTNGGLVDIENSGQITNITLNGFSESGSSLANLEDVVFSLVNLEGGVISSTLTINGGMSVVDNYGSFSGLNISSYDNDLVVNNYNIIDGNQFTIRNDSLGVTINNTGEISANIEQNNEDLTINQDSDTALEITIKGAQNASSIDINNIDDSNIDSILAGSYDTVLLNNENTAIDEASFILENTASIDETLEIDNSGYTKVNNIVDLSATITEISASVDSLVCLTNTIELVNSATISGDIDVQNSIFVVNNSGDINSSKILTRELDLTNTSDITSTISVSASVDVDNSGNIYGQEYAFRLSDETVTGTINNSGYIYSTGDTVIGYDESITACESCGEGLVINNIGGVISSGDENGAYNPTLTSLSIDLSSAEVNNIEGGIIAGSINVESYYQDSSSTWVAYMDNVDTFTMNTITVSDTITVDEGALIYIITNNNVREFEDGETYLFFDGSSEQEGLEETLANYVIESDTPFASYYTMAEDGDGYIVFNSVDARTFVNATDIASSNHGRIVSSSHRVYEMFVNKDTSTVTNLASGDNPFYDNKVSFMPIMGYANQESTASGSGYESKYYGAIGYYEHDLDIGWKVGLGLAYLHTNNDYKDDLSSDGQINTYRPFLFANYEKDRIQVDIAAGYAYHRVKDNRNYEFSDVTYVANSKYSSNEYSTHLNLGYKIWDENGEIVQPIAGLYAAHVETDSYEETGSGPMNMNVSSDDYNSLKSMIGIKLSKEYEYSAKTTFTPEIHLRWYHEFGDTSGGVTSYFLAQEQLFNNSGVESPKDIGDIALRITTSSEEMWDIFAEAYYQFGSSFYNVGGSVGLQYNF